MKKFIPKVIIDFLKWQKIKFLNRKRHQNKVIHSWINSGKKGLTPHVIKQQAIIDLQKKFNIYTLVETGTFMGEMVYAQRDHFKKIISIELSKELYQVARKRVRKFKHIEIINADSEKFLNSLIIKITVPAIFWLDGHYSGFETAKGASETPIKQELDAIFKSKLDHIVLIDDARLFVGQNGYPTIDELKKYVQSVKSDYAFLVEDDIIKIFKM
jgi:hypothetical protein